MSIGKPEQYGDGCDKNSGNSKFTFDVQQEHAFGSKIPEPLEPVSGFPVEEGQD